jgi:hypothetical protein
MLVRNGPYWKIAPHIRADSGFMELFFSNHLDEGLNPGLYVPGLRDSVREHATEYAQATLEHRRDRWGNRRSQAWFAHESRQLYTYWGVDYGHAGKEGELVLISDVCFKMPKDPMARDNVGRSPLHRAVAFANLKAVEDQLARGADVNDGVRSDEDFNSNWGDTPLEPPQ